jgi:uncharacterized protein
MRWQGGRQSDNVEDRRGMSPGPVMVGGGIGTLLLILLALFLGVDPQQIVQQVPGGGGGVAAGDGEPRELTEEEKEQGEFVRVVLADTEDVWTDLFAQAGKSYEVPKLTIYEGVEETGCGMGQASMGPFYCPLDRHVYIDLSFYSELADRFGAPGDFAQAYVIAHEIGHHVQNLLGTSEKVRRLQQRDPDEANDLSVRLELQADFYAGVWAHHAQKMRNILEPGDVEEALNAATQIGDDKLQKKAQGYIVPDSFTHGSGEQRVRWFRKGLQTGDPEQGDTFNDREL